MAPVPELCPHGGAPPSFLAQSGSGEELRASKSDPSASIDALKMSASIKTRTDSDDACAGKFYTHSSAEMNVFNASAVSVGHDLQPRHGRDHPMRLRSKPRLCWLCWLGMNRIRG